MSKFNTTMRFLFTPRTKSPTVAYYVGLLQGAMLAYYAYHFLEELREQREWEARLEVAREMQMDDTLPLHSID